MNYATRLLLATLWLLVSPLSQVFCQTPVLSFDGLGDYVNLGKEAADGARTIEFWFNLEESVDSDLEKEIFILGVEIEDPNITEWHFSLTRANSVNQAGTLRFVYVKSLNNVSQVYSDSKEWNANQWYHAALVIDEVEGMMLFVDGIKQQVQVPDYNKALTAVEADVEIARQNGFDRYFSGDFDDLRISADAIYLEDFIPPCPNIPQLTSTIGLWHFNEGEKKVAVDSGPNGYDGEIFGADWDVAFICRPTETEEVSNNLYLQLYPNPTSGLLTVELDILSNQNFELIISNSLGQIVKRLQVNEKRVTIDMGNESAGIYFYTLRNEKYKFASGQILILR